MNSGHWYLVSTKPKMDFVAERSLRSLGVEVYLPIFRRKIKKNKEKIETISPLFPGYLFSRFAIREYFHKVRYTRGVKAVLGSQDRLWTIEDEKIKDIRSREVDGVVVLRKRPEVFNPGDRIVIDEGDFDGWEGVFCEDMPDRKRAVILLTNVGFTSKMVVEKRLLKLNS